MRTNKGGSTRSILLYTEASEAELRAFEHVCARASCDVVRQSPSVNAEAAEHYLRVLLIGSGMATRASRRIDSSAPTFALLVTHDPAALDGEKLLQHCANVLVAPYDEAALAESLETLFGETLPPEVGANIIGESPQVRELLRVMARVARYDAPVLIKGETGTGKELVARGIHYTSSRSAQPFVPVNCGALNDELLLAELFGYEKGAFTDAKRNHRGLVAQAAGGVLFLDELDSLSPKGQAALLRFLQEQEYRPLGSESLYKGDVRVIAATNKDLEVQVARGEFREDLYYRVHLLDVELPPLRARTGDVHVLAEHFLAELSRRYSTPPKRLHASTLRWMTAYAWPGNVRELQNYLYRLFVLSPGPIIYVPSMKGNPVPLVGVSAAAAGTERLSAFSDEKARVLAEFERTYLDRVMAATKGNISLAARRAGKERRAFRRLLKKHGIERRRYETADRPDD